MEIVVDAYDEQERAMGWYYYLQDQLRFPFTATCIAKRSISQDWHYWVKMGYQF
ncbi:MAG: calcium-binding protein [Candidatus Rokuibacteriota bacterium]